MRSDCLRSDLKRDRSILSVKILLVCGFIIFIGALFLNTETKEEQVLNNSEEETNEVARLSDKIPMEELLLLSVETDQEKESGIESNFIPERAMEVRVIEEDDKIEVLFVVNRSLGLDLRIRDIQEKVEKEKQKKSEGKAVETQSNTKPEPEYVAGTNYTKEELNLLSRLVHAEAESEPYEGKLAVATVVMNRVVDDGYFPNSIHSVIHQQGQFSVFAPNWRINNTPNEDSVKASRQVLEGYRSFGEDVLYFYNPSTATDSWIFSRETVTTIGNHRFARNP